MSYQPGMPILAQGPFALGLNWVSRVDMACDMKNAVS